MFGLRNFVLNKYSVIALCIVYVEQKQTYYFVQ